MSSDTPASSEFAFDALTARLSISMPVMLSSESKSADSKADFFSSFQISFAMISQLSEAKFRLRPGAMFLAIIAASIGMVPDPQHGSTRILSLL